MNDVRAQLAAGIPPAEADAFRKHINTLVDEVEQICRARHRKPSDMPAPSYRAFQFLKTLDLRRLPIRPADAPPPPPTNFRIINQVAVCDDLHAEILALIDPQSRPPAAGDPRVAQLRARFAAETADTEHICREGRTLPEDLPIRSRRAYQWTRLLAQPGKLEAHLATVAAAIAVGRPLLAGDQRLRARRVETLAPRLYYSNTLVGGRVEGGAYSIRMHQGLMGAPDAVIDAAVRAAFGESWRLPVVRDYAHSDGFRAVVAALEGVGWAGEVDRSAGFDGSRDVGGIAGRSAAGIADGIVGGAIGGGADGMADKSTFGGDSLIHDIDDVAADTGPTQPADLRAVGRHHNLNAAFDRVNRAYFGGKMPRPKLTWNATFTRRKLGHYDFHTDTVMLSITLDDPKVPNYVVDFVMYHELLHKQLGVRAVNGRRRVHTPEFRRAERRFREWRKAERWLQGVGV
jgi:hypothetical protein